MNKTKRPLWSKIVISLCIIGAILLNVYIFVGDVVQSNRIITLILNILYLVLGLIVSHCVSVGIDAGIITKKGKDKKYFLILGIIIFAIIIALLFINFHKNTWLGITTTTHVMLAVIAMSTIVINDSKFKENLKQWVSNKKTIVKIAYITLVASLLFCIWFFDLYIRIPSYLWEYKGISASIIGAVQLVIIVHRNFGKKGFLRLVLAVVFLWISIICFMTANWIWGIIIIIVAGLFWASAKEDQAKR